MQNVGSVNQHQGVDLGQRCFYPEDYDALRGWRCLASFTIAYRLCIIFLYQYLSVSIGIG
jgi:hypothetical protein